MRKLAKIVSIDSITPIENADSLECAHVGGWQVVVRKDDFKPGDKALYFEIDSALNPHDDRYAFLRERCYKKFTAYGKLFDECIRIKTMKLRGVLSQGLLMKTDDFCEVRNKGIGDDCTAELAVRHYDEVASRAMKVSEKQVSADQKGLFPSFIPKTDEERIQNLPGYFSSLQDMEFEVTRKVDGSSMTVFYSPSNRPDDPFGICSRNFELKPECTESAYVQMAEKFKLKQALAFEHWESGLELAIQGELNGPGINKNRDCLTELDFKVFRIWDIKNACYLTPNQRILFCKKHHIPHVPVIERNFKAFTVFKSMDEMLKFSDGLTENGNPREGLVYKEENSSCPVTFKAVSNEYLLKEK